MSNDRSRAYKCNDSDTTIAELEAKNYRLRLFIEVFELYIGQQITSKRADYEAAGSLCNDSEYGALMALGDIKGEWHELKAQHLGEKEIEDDE